VPACYQSVHQFVAKLVNKVSLSICFPIATEVTKLS